MALTFHVDIVSAEKKLFSGRAEMLIASAVQGELGVLPGHTPMLTALQPGQIRLKMSDIEEETFYISGGLLEVQPDIVTVIADDADRADDLDEAKAIEAESKARDMLANKHGDIDHATALRELSIALAQLRAIKAIRKS